MLVWGVVSSEIEQVIKFFGSRREAERVLAEIAGGDAQCIGEFRIERIELGHESLN